MSETELEEPEMEVVGLVSFHRIFSLHDADTDDIDEVDEVDPDDGHCCRYLPSGDDSEGRDKKCEDNRPRVSHDARSMNIVVGDEGSNRQENHDKDEDKLTILDGGFGRIGDKKFEREKSEDDKTDEGKASSESGDAIREVDTIKDEDIPEYRDNQRDVVDSKNLSEEFELEKKFIEPQDSPKKIGNIANLDARNPDNEANAYLHSEPKYWRYRYPAFPDGVEVIECANNPDNC